MKLLFVCTGNICRSPTAEGLLKYICKINNYNNIYCDSAALFDYHIGSAPDKRAIKVAKKNNVNISNLKARLINKNDFKIFNLIIGMGKDHVKIMNKLSNNNNIELFLNFTTNYKNNSVPDPYYGTIKNFENTFELIEIGIQKIVKKYGY